VDPVSNGRERKHTASLEVPKMLKFLAVLAAAAFSLSIAGSNPAYAMGSSDSPAKTATSDYDDAVRAVEKKDYKQAIRLLSRVLEKTPKNADALNYMGFSHRKSGDHQKAIDYYKQALAVNPDHRGANEYLGEAYLEINDVPKAEERLAHLINVCGQNCKEARELSDAIAAHKSGTKPRQSSRRWD
jgi:tetratricopeptide (TPR) repeat protein